MNHKRLSIPIILVAIALNGLAATPAFSAKIKPADRAWIATCIDQRKAERNDPAALRKYCVCMQQIVDNNEPFEGITELERTYPPAHEGCYRSARLGRR